MQLSKQQLQHYDEHGYIVLKGLFSADEIELLRQEAGRLETKSRGHAEANTYEKNGRIRAAWAMEIDSAAYEAASRDPRVVEPVMQLLGREIYLFQSRLNYKIAFEGDVFQWHQDYTSWWYDGVPEIGHHQMLTVLITLDDTDSHNGPLRFIPGSHREGLIPPEYDTTTTSYPLHIVPDRDVDRLSAEAGIVENVGPAGTVAIFSGLLVHGSAANTSPRSRRNAYFAYNRWDNQPRRKESRRKLANKYITNFSPTRTEPYDTPVLPELAAKSSERV